MSVAGVVLLTPGAGFTAPGLGDLLILGAALARTLHVLLMARIKAVQDADSLSLTTVQLGSAVLVFATLPGTGSSPWAAAAGIAIGGEHLGAVGTAGVVLVLAGTAWGRHTAARTIVRK